MENAFLKTHRSAGLGVGLYSKTLRPELSVSCASLGETDYDNEVWPGHAAS